MVAQTISMNCWNVSVISEHRKSDSTRSCVTCSDYFQGQAVLDGKGHVSNGEMEAYAKEIYNRFNEKRKVMDAQNADEEDLRFLENLENEIKNKE